MGDSRAKLVGLVATLWGCAPNGPFDAPVELGGQVIDAAQLNRGREAYNFYCRTCHGEEGDGRGPASPELETPPRDFRLATYKFAGAADDGLPADDDLIRIVTNGLDGTAMLRWQIPPEMTDDIVQYIKTYSPVDEGWRDSDNEVGSLEITEDPWGAAKKAEAIARGRTVYHGFAECYACHPGYETRAEINRDRLATGNAPLPGFRARYWTPEAKASPTYTRPVSDDPACAEDTPCPDGDRQVCQFGRCEEKVVIRPPDFTLNRVRVGSQRADLYRIIAAGIPGTAMPRWQGGLGEEEIWAMAYYVESLVSMRGKPEARALKARLRADTAPLAALP